MTDFQIADSFGKIAVATLAMVRERLGLAL